MGRTRKTLWGACQGGKKKGLGLGLYYSHVDWHDPAFAWDPFNLYYDPHFTKASDPKRWQTFIDHEREQVRELMTDYGKIDYLDFDIGWPEAAAEDIAEITRMVRKLQPDVIIRGRGHRSLRGLLHAGAGNTRRALARCLESHLSLWASLFLPAQ